jgi:cytochrome oxidase assembly protein ShyY1
MRIPKTKTIFTVLTIAVLATTFFELGLWQLHRAQQSQSLSKNQPERPMVGLTAITSAGSNLSADAINRIVNTSGRYVHTYTAPGQFPLNSKGIKSKFPKSLEVRLLQLRNNQGVLVVRGLDQSVAQTINEDVSIVGRLYPRQSSDFAVAGKDELSRLDPALIVGDTKLQLLDGYIIVRNEKTAMGQSISENPIASPQIHSTVAGFYLQHLSYVFIWWLMGLVVIALPIFSRKADKVSV